MDRHICIHGHFYQPPRENPWLEMVEVQDSAYPFHDWNQRIAAECYAPNAASRMLDGEQRIIDIVNNYSRISFNFGPTLLIWLESEEPEVYKAVIEADRQSRERFSGHGSAIAQVYNHMIMPLANSRDKWTQAYWGVEDFRKRFGRDPEGMWLAETAVDLESLDILAQLGIKFTILAPSQAKAIRPVNGNGGNGENGNGGWEDVSGGRIDPTRPYLCKLPTGREIALFFYDGPVSRELAFQGLLNDGESFFGRLTSLFNDERDWPQLVHIATDGETYGHHHKYADMALAWCLHKVEESPAVGLTNYGEYLSRYAPVMEVEIWENSAWSCAHGVERWRSNCGCNSGMHGGWTQEWRKPLREAMDWLRDETIPFYEKRASKFFKDPWGARDRYVRAILDRRPENVGDYLVAEAGREMSVEEMSEALKLLEMQKHAMFMFTSCGWFFDEISGIETVQVMDYAYSVIQLVRGLGGPDLEGVYAARLEQAPSNVFANGREPFEKFVKSAALDLIRVGAHYALSSLFEEYPQEVGIYAYTARSENYDLKQAGRAKLATGKVVVTSNVVWSETAIVFAVVHLGDVNLRCGLRPFQGEEAYEAMCQAIREPFERGDMAEAVRQLDKVFGKTVYGLQHLFRDEQRKVLGEILALTNEAIERDFRNIYENNYATLNFLAWLNAPLPRSLVSASEVVAAMDIDRLFAKGEFDLERLRSLTDEIKKWRLNVDQGELGYLAGKWLAAQILDMDGADSAERMRIVDEALAMLKEVGTPVRDWKAQNIWLKAARNKRPEVAAEVQSGGEEGEKARVWLEAFDNLGRRLNMRVDGIERVSPLPEAAAVAGAGVV